jgi:hypothetical protein
MRNAGLLARNVTFAATLLLAAGGMALAADRTETVKFAAGASSATVKGAIKGYDGITYRLGASAGQVMQVLFSPSNRACYFNVMAPGSDEAVFNGSINGNEYSANLTRGGNYVVQVYMMRSAARRNETCKYSISFEISG